MPRLRLTFKDRVQFVEIVEADIESVYSQLKAQSYACWPIIFTLADGRIIMIGTEGFVSMIVETDKVQVNEFRYGN